MIKNQGQQRQKIVTIFDDIYNLPDCRSYYRAMDHAGFRTAHHAVGWFRKVQVELKRMRGLDATSVVDFASGYGIAAALLRHDLSLNDVLARYRDPWFDDATSDAVIAADRDWYAGARRAGDTDSYAGIDIADKALSYGRSVGIFDQVFPENLQENPLSDDLQATMAKCDLIVECGSVAHMLPDALDRLLQAAVRKPWIATAPIRGNDTSQAIDVMHRHGYDVASVTKVPFRHRRFADADEQARAIANAQARGHVTEGFETEGFFQAQVFLARPPHEVSEIA